MNCKEFESLVHELSGGRAADRTKQLEALEHAGGCLWCAMRLDKESKLTESLRGLRRALEGQSAPRRVEEALLQAFREARPGKAAPRFGFARKRRWQLGWGLALGAAAAIVWTIMAVGPRLHLRHHRPGDNQAVAPARQQEPSGPKQLQFAAPREAPSVAQVSSKPTEDRLGSSRRPSGAAGPARRAASDFISLGTCDDSECMDEALVVRVALPADAPLAFGLATDADDSVDGRVQAEVALGNDGVPFAIRFLN